MKQASRTIDVQAFIDAERFSPCQWLVLIFCFLIVAADGYDTAAIGFIAPSLAQEWGIPRSELGAVMSAALAGLSLGAIFAGPIADRIGRKTVLVAAVAAFGAWTLAAAHAQSLATLTVLRFLTGLGLGAAMPTTITMMSEYAPKRLRAFTVNAMYCGFSFGLVSGGAASAWLIPHFGWRSVLTAGGIGPLVLAVLLFALLPESAQFLAVRPGTRDKIARILQRIAPGQRLDACTFVARMGREAAGNKGSAFALILSQPYRRRTLLLWLSCFMGLVIYYLMTNWMPTLFREAGFSIEHGALLAAVFPLGGLLGNLVAGWLMDRFDANRTIVVAYLLAAVLVTVVGRCVDHPAYLGASLFACGTLVTSAATSMSTYAASLYPTEARTTGVAWMQGIGRIGGVAGSFAGGALLGIGWDFGAVFGLLAVPAVAAAWAVFMIARPRQAYPVTSAAK